jgi:hypothetical protein
MTSQEFVQQLDARILKYDLLCHPFYKAWTSLPPACRMDTFATPFWPPVTKNPVLTARVPTPTFGLISPRAWGEAATRVRSPSPQSRT